MITVMSIAGIIRMIRMGRMCRVQLSIEGRRACPIEHALRLSKIKRRRWIFRESATETQKGQPEEDVYRSNTEHEP